MEWMPSLSMIFALCASTVLTLMPSASAASLLALPLAKRQTISLSRFDNPHGGELLERSAYGISSFPFSELNLWSEVHCSLALREKQREFSLQMRVAGSK